MPSVRRTTLAACAALLTGLVTGPLPLASAHAADPAPLLRLRTGPIALGAASLTSNALPTLADHNTGQYVVQFTTPVGSATRRLLSGHGARVDGYLPDRAYLVRMTPRQARAVAALDGVHAVARFAPAWKRTAAVTTRIGQHRTSVYTVSLADGVPAEPARAAATAAGAVATISGQALLVAATPAQIEAISQREDVVNVDTYTPMKTFNETAVFGTMKGAAAAARGYDGSTQIAAVADTGFGTGVAATAHPGVPAERIKAIHDWATTDMPNCRKASPDGARDVSSGHGTHTATSVVGGGDANGLGRAAAYKASLVFQAVEDWIEPLGQCGNSFPKGYALGGLPTDLRGLFEQAYADGARVHSNSWGSIRNGNYDDNAANIDDFISNHRDMTITFAAGNGGEDKDKNGETDPDSIGAPATAKNSIAVGASESARASYNCDVTLTYTPQQAGEIRSWGKDATCASMGGQMKIPTWGAWYPSMAPVEPMKSDPQNGNDQQMAPFSGRGPTDDGRIKPDVVAPGTWIASGYSPLYRQGYDSAPNPQNGAYQGDGFGFPLNGSYKFNTGTSMANPLLAGGATVVRDYYQKKYDQNASAALVKATLVNTAVDLLDENEDGKNDNRYPIPNIHEGWGLTNLDKATAGTALWLDEGAGLDTGGQREFTVSAKPGTPLKITMAWSDPAAKPAAATTLVNDLDLEVTGPDGIRLGNTFSGGWSSIGGSADRKNNLENVFLANPTAGNYTVRVKGASVPMGPQTFALVMDGATPVGNGVNRNPKLTAPGLQHTSPGTPVNMQLAGVDPDGDPLTWTATGLPDGLTIGAGNGLISGTPTKAGRYTAKVLANDGRQGQASASFYWDIVPSAATNLVGNPGFENGATGWTGDTSAIVEATNPAHGGTHYARFSDIKNTKQQLSTQITVPAGASGAKVWFWVQISSLEASSFDRDTLILDVSGTQVAKVSNIQAGPGWQLVMADLSAYAGRTVPLRWTAQQDKGLPTTFTIDDVVATPVAN